MIQITMANCRSGLKNRAMLRNLTSLSPIIENRTRWSGKFAMLTRFFRIYDSIKKVAVDENFDIVMNFIPSFKQAVAHYQARFKEFNDMTLFLQQKHFSVSDCRLAVENLTKLLERRRDNPTTKFYQCNLEDSYISNGAFIFQIDGLNLESLKFNGNKLNN